MPRKIILFGSYIRGDMHLNSDLDILIVTGDEIKNPRKVKCKNPEEDLSENRSDVGEQEKKNGWHLSLEGIIEAGKLNGKIKIDPLLTQLE